MISIRLRRLYRRLSYLTGWSGDFRPGMQGSIPFRLQSVPEPIGVIAPVVQQPSRLWQIVQQRGRTGVIADLASGHEKVERAAVRIGDGVKLQARLGMLR